MPRKLSLWLITLFILACVHVYADHEIIELSSSSLTLEYQNKNSESSLDYIILPQDSYNKIELHNTHTSTGEFIEFSDNVSSLPVSLEYRGKVHFFHLFRLRISDTLQYDDQNHQIERLKYSIHFASETSLTEKSFNSHMLPFFEKHVLNAEHLPYFVSHPSLPEETEKRLAFFQQEGHFFYLHKEPGFYKVDLKEIEEDNPDINAEKPLFFDHEFNQLPSHIRSNHAIYYQPEYEDKFTDKSAVWLMFPESEKKEAKEFPLHIPESSPQQPGQDFYLTEYQATAPRDYYFPDKDPDALPDAREAILYHLECNQYSQSKTITLPNRSSTQPDTLPLSLSFANPHRAHDVNYRIAWNNREIGRLESTNNEEFFRIELEIPHQVFRGVRRHTLTIINEDDPRNVLYLTDFNVKYNIRLDSTDPMVIDTSLEQTGNPLELPTIYHDYPLVFFQMNDSIKRYSYHFDERYNYAGDRLINVLLPGSTEEKGIFHFFPAQTVPAANPEPFEPPLDSLKKDAEVLLITHPEFKDIAEQYAEIHPDHLIGIYSIKDLYHVFTGGLHTPEAIQHFLTYRLSITREVVPEFAIFLGDCTNDYKNRLGTDIRNYVPTMRYYRGREGFASDYKLGSLLGEGFFNDIILARLPFNNREDFENYLDKASHYKNREEMEEWNHHIAYLADDDGFERYTNKLYEDVPPVLESTKIHLKDYLLEDNFYIPWEVAYQERIKVSPECTSDILDLLQEGVAFSQYLGHGAPNILSHERILFGGDSDNSDFLNLEANYRPTFMSMMTCSTGAIDYPLPPWNINISEDFLRTRGSGAIALFVPSGKGYPTQHMVLSRLLQDYVFFDNVRNFGSIVSNTLNSYYLEEENEFHSAMFLLLGDPLLDLQLPELHPSLEITPSHTGKKSPQDLEISAPFSSERNVPSVLTRREDFTREHNLFNPLQVPDEAGTYYLKANKDNIIHYGNFEVTDYAPSLTKKQEEEPLKPGENTFTLQIENPSQIDWYEGELDFQLSLLSDGKDSQTRTASFSHLKPESTESFNFSAELKPGIYQSRVSLNIAGIEVYENTRHWFVPFDDYQEKGKDSLLMISAHPESYILTGGQSSLQFTLFNPTDTVLEDISLNLTTPQLDSYLIEDKTFTLSPFEKKSWKWDEHFPLQDMDAASEYLTFKISGKNTDILPEEFNIPLLKPGYLELVSPIKISPSSPFEGQSLFFELTIQNTGDRKSSRSGIQFYEKKEGEEAETLQVTPRPHIEPLKPGEKKSVRFRHSPWKNQGNRIYSTSIEENRGTFEPEYASKEIYIRENFNFQTHRAMTMGPRTEEDREERAVYLQAIFSNTGERDAEGVVVNFFRSSSQTPENKIGEIYLDKVEAGKTYSVPLRWENVPEGFVRWTYNVGLKVSTARVSHVEEAEHEAELVEELQE